jgi:DNA replication protein DnaC
MECPEGICDGSGFTYDLETRRAFPCSCRPRRIARKKAQKLAGVIPRRYQGVSFDRPPVTQMNPHVVRAVRRYVDTLEAQLSSGRGIWFQGDIGTGKTTLAMLISAEALRQGWSVAIYSLPRLLAMLRESFNEGSEASLAELLDRLAAVDLLHIDDVGAEQTSPWVLEQLYTIVNTRYEDARAIVVTTNLDDRQLREQIGDRTVSRLVEMCGDPLPMFGDDNRMALEAMPAPAAPEPRPVVPLEPWEEPEDLAYGEPRRLRDAS